jgi:hypothetical protein
MVSYRHTKAIPSIPLQGKAMPPATSSSVPLTNQYRTTAVLQLIRVIGIPTNLMSGMKNGGSSSSGTNRRQRKQEIIYIDTDSEGEDEVLVTPTKRQRSPQREKEDIKPRLKTPKVEYYQKRRLEQDVKPFVGLGRAPNTGGRNVQPSFGRDVKPDVKPVLTAMGKLSVSSTSTIAWSHIARLIEQLGGRKRGKTPVLFRFNPWSWSSIQ